MVNWSDFSLLRYSNTNMYSSEYLKIIYDKHFVNWIQHLDHSKLDYPERTMCEGHWAFSLACDDLIGIS